MRVGTVKTLKQLAEAFDVAYRVVKDWPKRDGFPREEDGTYHLVQIAIWRERTFDQRRMQVAADGAEGDETLQEAKRRREWAKAREAELKLEELAGELVSVDAVRRLFERHVAEHNSQAAQLKDRVLAALPARLTADEKRGILKAVDKAVDDLRHGIADAAEDWAREVDDAEDEDEA